MIHGPERLTRTLVSEMCYSDPTVICHETARTSFRIDKNLSYKEPKEETFITHRDECDFKIHFAV